MIEPVQMLTTQCNMHILYDDLAMLPVLTTNDKAMEPLCSKQLSPELCIGGEIYTSLHNGRGKYILISWFFRISIKKFRMESDIIIETI
jgi:hypothetical protein